MTLLLDTCTFLWLLSDDPRLPLRARTECRAPSNAVYLSALSVWEITIKYRLGRLPLPESPELFVASRRQRLQIEPLPYDERDAVHDVLLPPHHRDPFDRGLVSQAILRGLDDRDARPVDRTLSGPRALAVMVAAARTPTVWPGEGGRSEACQAGDRIDVFFGNSTIPPTANRVPHCATQAP